MKFYLPLIFSLALLVSCAAPEKPKEASSVSAQKDSLISEKDTFYIGKKLFYAEQISKAEFDKIPSPPAPDTSEKNNLLRDSLQAYRLGNRIILDCGNNETMVFADVDHEGYDDNAHYTYLGHLKEITRFLLLGSYHESFSYLLLDPLSGDTTYICGYPVFSPDKKYFICGNTDLIARFVVNGFDLYEASNGKIRFIGRRELDTWGPEEIKWVNDSVLFVQRNVLDTTVENMIRTDYVKLLMR